MQSSQPEPISKEEHKTTIEGYIKTSKKCPNIGSCCGDCLKKRTTSK